MAAAPLMTDVPIIGLGLLLYSGLPEPAFVLGVVSFVGSAFVGYLGVSSLRRQPVEIRCSATPPRSYLKGSLANALSPHPYLFWLTVGIPTMLKATSRSTLAAAAFVAAFYVCIVGSKMAIALLVGRSQRFLAGPAYLRAVRLLGLLLLGFSALLFYDGLTLTGIVR